MKKTVLAAVFMFGAVAGCAANTSSDEPNRDSLVDAVEQAEANGEAISLTHGEGEEARTVVVQGDKLSELAGQLERTADLSVEEVVHKFIQTTIEDSSEEGQQTFAVGVCTPVLTAHIKKYHVGFSDADLIKSAKYTGNNYASSWKSNADALSAIKSLVNTNCEAMKTWQDSYQVGAEKKFQAATSVVGRGCDSWGECDNLKRIEAWYVIVLKAGAIKVGVIKTGYPVQ